MAVSVRMEPILEKELELAAKRKGITKSQFIIEAVERALGQKDPYVLLLQVQDEAAAYALDEPQVADRVPEQDDASSPRKQKLKAIMKSKYDREQADWVAYQSAKSRGEPWNPDTGEGPK